MIPKVGGFFRMGGAIFPPVVDGDCAMCDFIIEVREDMLAKCIQVVAAVSDEYRSYENNEQWKHQHTIAALRALREKP
jgi:hypothetical protein